MRNTLQYPISLDEMIHAVERAAAEATEALRDPGAPIGGIHAAALQEAAKRLKRLAFAVAEE